MTIEQVIRTQVAQVREEMEKTKTTLYPESLANVAQLAQLFLPGSQLVSSGQGKLLQPYLVLKFRAAGESVAGGDENFQEFMRGKALTLNLVADVYPLGEEERLEVLALCDILEAAVLAMERASGLVNL